MQHVKAEDLSCYHLGMLVLVDLENTSIEDTLSGVSHQAGFVDERNVAAGELRCLIDQVTTVLTFANAGQVQVPGGTPVSLLLRGPLG
jgi:hypothetical protein